VPKPFESTINMLLDVGLDTLIGALILAVLIAMVTASAYLWLRRGKADVTALLAALIVVTNVACLVTGAGFIEWRSRSTKSDLALARPGLFASGHERWQNNISRRSERHPRWRRNTAPEHAVATQNVIGKPEAISPE
jgi:predicted PurR-regulated permease PerM